MKKQNSRKSTGAPRISWPIIEGIASCAARIGVSEALIKRVKKNGSRAFLAGNRVDTAILIPELFAALATKSELPPGVVSPQDWLAREKAKREQIRRENEQGLLMATADAEHQAAEAMAFTFAELERFARELPPAMAGLSAIEIAKRMSSEIERMRRELKEKFQAIGK